MAIERQFQPDEWFPRNEKGTCYGGGPSSTSDIIERRIAENMQRRLESEWEKVHSTFQSYAAALAKYYSFEEAERRANRTFKELCFSWSGGVKYGKKGVTFVGVVHLPNFKDQKFLHLQRFILASNGQLPDAVICGKCVTVVGQSRLAEHELKCQGPHRGSVGLKVPSGKM